MDKSPYDELPNVKIMSCIGDAELRMMEGTSSNLDSLNKVKMELCKPFKTIIENCTLPVTECIGNIATKEIVMAEILKMMEEVVRCTQPQFVGDFAFDDCKIFGGNVSKGSMQSKSMANMIIPVILILIFFFS